MMSNDLKHQLTALSVAGMAMPSETGMNVANTAMAALERIESLEARLADSVVIKEKLNELASAITSVNRGNHNLVPESVTGDDEPCYWQRKEWIDWMLELSEEAGQLLSEGK